MDVRLIIFLEGDRDEQFFDGVIRPLLINRYSLVRYYKYSQKPKDKIRQYLRSMVTPGWDYLFVADLDDHSSVSMKKRKIMNLYDFIDEDKIIIVKCEIESWYVAGVDNIFCGKHKIKYENRTENVSKEKMESNISKDIISMTALMAEIIKNYSLKEAIRRNSSIKYFVEKYNLLELND